MTTKQIVGMQMKAARHMNKTYSDMLFISKHDLQRLLEDTAELAFKEGELSGTVQTAVTLTATSTEMRKRKRPAQVAVHSHDCTCTKCENEL